MHALVRTLALSSENEVVAVNKSYRIRIYVASVVRDRHTFRCFSSAPLSTPIARLNAGEEGKIYIYFFFLSSIIHSMANIINARKFK